MDCVLFRVHFEWRVEALTASRPGTIAPVPPFGVGEILTLDAGTPRMPGQQSDSSANRAQLSAALGMTGEERTDAGSSRQDSPPLAVVSGGSTELRGGEGFGDWAAFQGLSDASESHVCTRT